MEGLGIREEWRRDAVNVYWPSRSFADPIYTHPLHKSHTRQLIGQGASGKAYHVKGDGSNGGGVDWVVKVGPYYVVGGWW